MTESLWSQLKKLYPAYLQQGMIPEWMSAAKTKGVGNPYGAGGGQGGYSGGQGGYSGGQGIYDWQYDLIKQLYPWFGASISQTPRKRQYWSMPSGYGATDLGGMSRRGGGEGMPRWLDEMAKMITSPRLAQGMQQAGRGNVGTQLRDLMWGMIQSPRESLEDAWSMLHYLMPQTPSMQGMTDHEIEQLLQTIL